MNTIELFFQGYCRTGENTIPCDLLICQQYKCCCESSNTLLDCHSQCKHQEKILKMLYMQNTKIVYLSPDKANVKYVVKMANKNGDLDKTFGWLIKDLIDNASSTNYYLLFIIQRMWRHL